MENVVQMGGVASQIADAVKRSGVQGPEQKESDDKLRDIHREALTRYNEAWDWDNENRQEAVIDLNFKAGDQWAAEDRNERQEEGRPIMTVNLIPKFVRQVTGDARANKPSIKVDPVDDNADVETAKVFSGLIRNIEHQSDALHAYLTALDGAATCGIGNHRVTTEYSSDDTFEQDIRIRAIPDHLAVLWDPDAVLPTREDAKFCFVLQQMTRERFQTLYPDARADEFDRNNVNGIDVTRWTSDNLLTVAEYWVKVPVTRTIAQRRDGSVVDMTDMSEQEIAQEWPTLKFDMAGQPKTRDVQSHRVYQYILSGSQVLEGPYEWAGRYIPIVPTLGEETHVENRVIRHGLVRFARDPQRMYNYWRSSMTETVALQPKAPWLVTDKMVANHISSWSMANKKNLPFLTYTPDEKQPNGPRRDSPPVPSAGQLQEANMANFEMKDVTGIYDAALGAQSNEISGKAIRARQMESDTGTAVYHDNMKRAIMHTGTILVDLIPRIYDTERVVRVMGEDGTTENAMLSPGVQAPSRYGEMIRVDISRGKYDVAVQVGPSYATKRQESADSMISFIQAVPQAAPLIGDLVAKNLDWPGAEEIADRLQAVAQQSMGGSQQPDPKDMAKAQRDMAEAQKTQAETRSVSLDNIDKELELAARNGQLQALIGQMVQQSIASFFASMAQGQPPTPPPAGAMAGPPPEGMFRA